jgi:hypothetical protein
VESRQASERRTTWQQKQYPMLDSLDAFWAVGRGDLAVERGAVALGALLGGVHQQRVETLNAHSDTVSGCPTDKHQCGLARQTPSLVRGEERTWMQLASLK